MQFELKQSAFEKYFESLCQNGLFDNFSLFDDILLLRHIAGAFGKVFEASLRSLEDGSSRTVAIKTIKGSNTNICLRVRTVSQKICGNSYGN